MRVVQTNVISDMGGSVRRLERGSVTRRVENQYVHVQEPVMVERPRIEDFNNMVVIHDQIEQYI